MAADPEEYDNLERAIVRTQGRSIAEGVVIPSESQERSCALPDEPASAKLHESGVAEEEEELLADAPRKVADTSNSKNDEKFYADVFAGIDDIPVGAEDMCADDELFANPARLDSDSEDELDEEQPSGSGD